MIEIYILIVIMVITLATPKGIFKRIENWCDKEIKKDKEDE